MSSYNIHTLKTFLFTNSCPSTHPTMDISAFLTTCTSKATWSFCCASMELELASR